MSFVPRRRPELVTGVAQRLFRRALSSAPELASLERELTELQDRIRALAVGVEIAPAPAAPAAPLGSKNASGSSTRIL